MKDTVREAAVGMLGRPGRVWLSIIGMAIGIAALVAIIGIAQSAGNQILSRLLTVDRTLIRVSSSQLADADAIGWEAEESVLRIDGVAAAGTLGPVRQSAEVAKRLQSSARVVQLDVLAATPGIADVLGAEVVRGRFLDPPLKGRELRTAVLGSGAARLLDYRDLSPGKDAIFIEGIAFSVVGILDVSSIDSNLSSAVFVSPGSISDPSLLPDVMYVRTDTNAAGVVAPQLARVISPNRPNSLSVSAPVGLDQLRRGVESDIDALFVTLGAVALVVAAIGIANVTLISVIERRPEIGLRRALGATRTRIGAEFLAESTILGVFGGVVGVAMGVIVVATMATIRDWLPILDPTVLGAGVLLGALTGMVSGIYPALRAANLEPNAALKAV